MNQVKLENIVSTITSGSRGWASYYADDGALFLRMTNLPKHGINILLNDNKFVQLPPNLNEGKRTVVQNGDILISITAELGKIGYVENLPFKEAYVNQHVCLVRPILKDVNPKFLAYYLSAYNQRNLLNRLNDSGAKSGLNLSTISKFPVSLPDKNTQKFIADALQTWDTAIAKTEALISSKEEQFDWLIRELTNRSTAPTKKLDLHFGNDIMIEKGKSLTKDNVVNGDIPVIAGGKSSPYRHNRSTHTIPCITISASGAHAGYVSYHDYPIWASDCNVISSEKHSIQYLYYALKSKQVEIYALQSRGAQPHVYSRDLKTIEIPLPPIHEQHRIAEILSTAQREIDVLKKLIAQYQRQKRGLLHKLLTEAL